MGYQMDSQGNGDLPADVLGGWDVCWPVRDRRRHRKGAAYAGNGSASFGCLCHCSVYDLLHGVFSKLQLRFSRRDGMELRMAHAADGVYFHIDWANDAEQARETDWAIESDCFCDCGDCGGECCVDDGGRYRVKCEVSLE